MERKKLRIQVRQQTNGVIGGDLYRKKSRANRRKEGTPTTKNNKLTKIQAKYRRLFKNSTISKGKDEKPPLKPHFCDKYPTLDSYLKTFILRSQRKEKAGI